MLESCPLNAPDRLFGLLPDKLRRDELWRFFARADHNADLAALRELTSRCRVLGDHHIPLDILGPGPRQCAGEETGLPGRALGPGPPLPRGAGGLRPPPAPPAPA